MNIFEALIVGHMTGDFLLQTRWMAYNKENSLGPLIVHSAVYTLCVFVFAFPVAVLPVWSLALILCSHAFLDQRNFLRWWIIHVNGSADVYKETPYMKMIVDQSFHLLILALVAYWCMLI